MLLPILVLFLEVSCSSRRCSVQASTRISHHLLDLPCGTVGLSLAVSTMDPSVLQQRHVELSRPSAMSNATRHESIQISNALQSYLRERVDKQLRDAGASSPAMYVYLSDGWGCFVQDTFEDTRFRVTRRGKHRAEFLLERAIVFTLDADDRIVSSMLCKMPRGMSAGRKGWNVFTAACEFCPTLRYMGAPGITVSLYLQDGLFKDCFGEMMIGRHRLYYTSGAVREHHVGDVDQLMASDWVLHCKCLCHAVSLSIKWGLTPFGGKDIVDDAFISIESLRTGSKYLLMAVAPFLRAHLKFKDPACDMATARQFWLHLDIPLDMIDLFLEVHPWYDGTDLCVRTALASDKDVLAKVAACVMHCTRFSKFSETRWAGVLSTGRKFILGMLVGVPGIFRMCEGDANVHMAQLGGFARASPKVRRYLTLSGLGPIGAHTVALELLRDDRWLLRAEEIVAKAREELDELISLPTYFWDTVALVVDCGWDARALKSATIQVANIAMGYIHRECVAMLYQEPWCHTQGDVEANVEAIGRREPQDIFNYTTLQIWRLLRGFGVPVVSVVRALVLLKNACFSTTLVEQSHGGGAAILRQHRLFEAAMLCACSLLHQTRHMSTRLPEEIRMHKLLSEIERLEAYKARFGGAQVFMGQAVARGSSAAHRALFQDCVDFESTQQAPARADEEYKKLSHQQRFQFQAAAADLKRRRLQQRAEEAEEARTQVSICKMRIRALQDSSRAVHVENFKFTDHDYEQLAKMLGEPRFKGQRVMNLHEKRLRPPQGVGLEGRAEIEAAAAEVRFAPSARVPWWSFSHVAKNRAAFEGCVLGTPDGDEYFLFFCTPSRHHATRLSCVCACLSFTALLGPCSSQRARQRDSVPSARLGSGGLLSMRLTGRCSSWKTQRSRSFPHAPSAAGASSLLVFQDGSTNSCASTRARKARTRQRRAPRERRLREPTGRRRFSPCTLGLPSKTLVSLCPPSAGREVEGSTSGNRAICQQRLTGPGGRRTRRRATRRATRGTTRRRARRRARGRERRSIAMQTLTNSTRRRCGMRSIWRRTSSLSGRGMGTSRRGLCAGDLRTN